MSRSTLPLSQNGAKSTLIPARSGTSHPSRVVDLQQILQERASRGRLAELAEQVEHLYELRALLRTAEATERDMTREILDGLAAAGLTRLEGAGVCAVLDTRTTLKPDPELFHEALGLAAYGALSVNTTIARRLMPADDLVAISETETTAVLRITAIAPETGAA